MKIAVLNGEPWQMDFLKNISDTALITAQNTEMLFAQKANAFITPVYRAPWKLPEV